MGNHDSYSDSSPNLENWFIRKAGSQAPSSHAALAAKIIGRLLYLRPDVERERASPGGDRSRVIRTGQHVGAPCRRRAWRRGSGLAPATAPLALAP